MALKYKLTVEEILKGLRFRLKGLKETRESIVKTNLTWADDDNQARIDEVESLIYWIKEKK